MAFTMFNRYIESVSSNKENVQKNLGGVIIIVQTNLLNKDTWKITPIS